MSRMNMVPWPGMCPSRPGPHYTTGSSNLKLNTFSCHMLSLVQLHKTINCIEWEGSHSFLLLTSSFRGLGRSLNIPQNNGSFIQLGHYLLYISFSSGTFSQVHAGGRPLPLYHYLSTAINVRLWDLKGHTTCERGTKCGICGVSAPSCFLEETYFKWLAVSLVVPNRHASQNYRCIQNTSSKSTQ